MAQGESKARVATIALALFAMIAAISLAALPVSAGKVDTGNLGKSEVQICDNHSQYLAISLNSDFLSCHICCAKKHKSLKFMLKGSEIVDEKCKCVVESIKEED